tara:strand:+ start:96 stop:1976 length:1881 start_codon:yes stop_codon:yes gene_type:complete
VNEDQHFLFRDTEGIAPPNNGNMYPFVTPLYNRIFEAGTTYLDNRIAMFAFEPFPEPGATAGKVGAATASDIEKANHSYFAVIPTAQPETDENWAIYEFALVQNGSNNSVAMRPDLIEGTTHVIFDPSTPATASWDGGWQYNKAQYPDLYERNTPVFYLRNGVTFEDDGTELRAIVKFYNHTHTPMAGNVVSAASPEGPWVVRGSWSLTAPLQSVGNTPSGGYEIDISLGTNVIQTNWVVTCGTNAVASDGTQPFLIDGVNIQSEANGGPLPAGGPGNMHLYINEENAHEQVRSVYNDATMINSSDCEVVEVVVWPRALTTEEMQAVSDHMMYNVLRKPLPERLQRFVPVITLIGDGISSDSPYTWIQGEILSWSEPGYTALDENNQNVVSLVTVDSSGIDFNTAGDYQVFYDLNSSYALYTQEDINLARKIRYVKVMANIPDNSLFTWKYPAEHSVVCNDYHPLYGGGELVVGGNPGGYTLTAASDSAYGTPYHSGFGNVGGQHTTFGVRGTTIDLDNYVDFIFTFQDANTWVNGYRQFGHTSWGSGTFTKDIEIYTGDVLFGPWTLVATDSHSASTQFDSGVTTEWTPTAPSKYLLVRTLSNQSTGNDTRLTVAMLQLRFAVGS